MKAEPADLTRIYYLFERARKKARGLYFEKFGREVDDSGIDEELESILRNQWPDLIETIDVPTSLILAIIMRPRGKGAGRKRPPKERWAKRQENFLIWRANVLWAKLVEAGEKANRARHKAALQALANPRYEFARLSVKVLENRMRLAEGMQKVRRDNPAAFARFQNVRRSAEAH